MITNLLVPVDGKTLDWPRKAANAINFLLRRTQDGENATTSLDDRVTALEGSTGYGWVDYSDVTGSATALAAGTQSQVTRNLTVSGPNNRLRGVFAGHAFWDNTVKVIRPRGLYDVITMSIYILVTPSAAGGVLDVALMAGTVDIGTKSFPMTGSAGDPQGLRADFIIPVRNSFLNNGAKVMLTASVDTSVTEFSPEFFPLGYEA